MPKETAATPVFSPSNEHRALYAHYLRGDLDIYELINEMARENAHVKEKGVIYTPRSIARFMVRQANPGLFDRVLEPSCGHGTFLFALMEHVSESFGLDPKRLFEWCLDRVSAIDIADKAVREARELLSLYFRKRSLFVAPEAFTNVIQGDALRQDFPSRFSLCVGNPPYVRVQNIEGSYLSFLRSQFETCRKGNIDLYYAFMEMALMRADRVVLITPNSFLHNASGKAIKARIMQRLERLIDFRHRKVFPNAGAYTCIIQAGGKRDSYLYSEDLSAETCLIPKATTAVAGKNDFEVLSGIATLKDRVFRVQFIDGKFIAKGAGRGHEVEKDAVVPLLKLTKLRGAHDYMIYPYGRDGRVIDESILRSNYPKAHDYLLSVKPLLMMRDKGKVDGYDAWYAYGRRQGLKRIGADEALAVPQMLGGNCVPAIVPLGSLSRGFRGIVFTSGYLIPLNPKNRPLVDFVLSERFDEFVRRVGKPWPGKDFLYYTITSRQLRALDPS